MREKFSAKSSQTMFFNWTERKIHLFHPRYSELSFCTRYPNFCFETILYNTEFCKQQLYCHLSKQ